MLHFLILGCSSSSFAFSSCDGQLWKARGLRPMVLGEKRAQALRELQASEAHESNWRGPRRQRRPWPPPLIEGQVLRSDAPTHYHALGPGEAAPSTQAELSLAAQQQSQHAAEAPVVPQQLHLRAGGDEGGGSLSCRTVLFLQQTQQGRATSTTAAGGGGGSASALAASLPPLRESPRTLLLLPPGLRPRAAGRLSSAAPAPLLQPQEQQDYSSLSAAVAETRRARVVSGPPRELSQRAQARWCRLSPPR